MSLSVFALSVTSVTNISNEYILKITDKTNGVELYSGISFDIIDWLWWVKLVSLSM